MPSWKIHHSLIVIALAFLCSVSALQEREKQDNAGFKLFGGRSYKQRNVFEDEEESTMLRENANSFKTLGGRGLKGRGLPKHNAIKSFGGRSLMKRFTDTEKCEKLEEALQDVIKALHSSANAELESDFKQAFLDSTDIDWDDKEALRTFICLITSVDSLEDVAQLSGRSIDEVKSQYQEIVDGINSSRASLQEGIGSPSLPEEMREITKAILRLYDVIEEIGMLSLS